MATLGSEKIVKKHSPIVIRPNKTEPTGFFVVQLHVEPIEKVEMSRQPIKTTKK